MYMLCLILVPLILLYPLYFVEKHSILHEPLETTLSTETSTRDISVTYYIYKSCIIRIGDKELMSNLIVLAMEDFNVILRIDWPVSWYALMDCHKKIMNFYILGQLEFSFIGSTGTAPP